VDTATVTNGSSGAVTTTVATPEGQVISSTTTAPAPSGHATSTVNVWA
jgi:hypothetical protein